MSEYWGGHVLLDPFDLEKIFSSDSSLASLPSVWEGASEDSEEEFSKVKPFLDKIPPRESDFLELYFFKKVRQTGIAELFNVSQPTVCYRLSRGAARLKYLMSLPPYTVEEVESALKNADFDEVDIKIMIGILVSTCQSEVARELDVSQGFVRHRFFRTLAAIQRRDGLEKYAVLFRHVAENFNILKDTCRFSWREEVIHSVSWR